MTENPSPPCPTPPGPRRVVVVSGLSGAGKATILRLLEDLGYEAVDNPPLTLLAAVVARGDRPLAIGIDARTQGFDPAAALAALDRLRQDTSLRPELVVAWADESVLLRRFTETRRRHPLAPAGRVTDGIAEEAALTAPLRDAADLLLDTSDLPLPELRRMIEQRFGGLAPETTGLTVSLVSFAYPAGLPREADLVFDARFLRNPHYDPILRPLTGLDAAVAAFVEADPDFAPFMEMVETLLTRLLPRFVQEGKKYLCVAVGCTGGRHRSVLIVEMLKHYLAQTGAGGPGWRVTATHRELARGLGGRRATDRPIAGLAPPLVQAQEA
jgi:RNase adapter protein RapZ